MRLVLLYALSVCSFAQDKPATKSKAAAVKDVDPLALEVLKAVSQPIEQAQTFTFKALVSEEQLATNGQIVAFFHTTEITVQHPDKVHLIFKGCGERADCYGTSGSVTMYAPDTKLYSTMPAKATIDDNLADITAKGIDMPVGRTLASAADDRRLGSGGRFSGCVFVGHWFFCRTLRSSHTRETHQPTY